MKSNGKVKGRGQELTSEEQGKKIMKEREQRIETGGKMLVSNAAKQNEPGIARLRKKTKYERATPRNRVSEG